MAEDIYEVDQIIGRRLTREGKEDYLVHWQNFSPIFSTWEPLGNVFDCQAAVKEFYDQHWPIPGTQATEVLHLKAEPKPAKVKQELLTLNNLPARKGKKLLKGARRDLKEEILRLQLENVANGNNDKPPLTSDKNINQDNMLTRLSHSASPAKFQSLEYRKNGIKRKKVNMDQLTPKPVKEPTRLFKKNKSKYLRSVKEKHKKQKKSFFKMKSYELRQDTPMTKNHVMPPQIKQESGLFNERLPSRLTRQSLPSCSTACMLDEELVVTNENGCMYIKFCNEAKKNVINLQMCEKMISSLHDATKDDVSLVVFTGSGSSFCFGWDLDQFKDLRQSMRQDLLQKYRLMVRLLVTCSKPMIAAVNGPAVGFGVSLASLCDIVLANNEVTFETKFAEWGHPPVGGCTYTLPNLMGPGKAMSMLLLNNKLSATVAQQRGLVTEILETDFAEQLKSTVQRLRSMPTQCLQDTKWLLHESKVQELANASKGECDLFWKYISNDVTLNSILKRWKSTIEN